MWSTVNFSTWCSILTTLLLLLPLLRHKPNFRFFSFKFINIFLMSSATFYSHFVLCFYHSYLLIKQLFYYGILRRHRSPTLFIQLFFSVMRLVKKCVNSQKQCVLKLGTCLFELSPFSPNNILIFLFCCLFWKTKQNIKFKLCQKNWHFEGKL